MSNENKLSTAPAGAVAQKTAGGGALSVFADGASFNTALRMAQCLASSTVVPKEYHGNVGNCMIAIEMASRINTSPMMVMQNLYIVNGRPAWSSQWIMKASGICEVRKNKHYPRAGTPLYCCQSKKACLDFDERGERPIRYQEA